MAVYIVNRFTEEFRANQVAFRTSTRDFLQGQLQGYRAQLTEAESELNTFMSTMATATMTNVSVHAFNLTVAENNLGPLEDQVQWSRCSRMIHRLEQQVNALVGTGLNVARYETDQTIAAIVREMRDLALDQIVLAPDAVGYRDMQMRLGQLRVRLNSLIEQRAAADFPNLGFMDRNQVSQYIYHSIFRNSTRSVIDSMTKQIRDFRDFTTRQPAQSARLAELQDEVDPGA